MNTTLKQYSLYSDDQCVSILYAVHMCLFCTVFSLAAGEPVSSDSSSVAETFSPTCSVEVGGAGGSSQTRLSCSQGGFIGRQTKGLDLQRGWRQTAGRERGRAALTHRHRDWDSRTKAGTDTGAFTFPLYARQQYFSIPSGSPGALEPMLVHWGGHGLPGGCML